MEKNTGKLFTPVHGTPMDYLRWRGDLTFRQDGFNEVDNLVLCIISYINFRRITAVHTTEPSAAPTLAQVAPLLTEEDDQLGLSELSYLPLVQLAAKTPRFRGVRLFAYTHEYDEAQAKQFDALSFLLPDGTLFVAFMGTDTSLAGWKEDFNMSFLSAVPAQARAAAYAADMAALCPDMPLRIGGHSKGGNLAAWAAIHLPADLQEHRLLSAYNNDGPGFARDMLETPEYLRVADKLHTYIPESSIVGVLLEHAEDYAVIDSANRSVMQHEPMSWSVIGPRFVHLGQRSQMGKLSDGVLQEWIGSRRAGAVHRRAVRRAVPVRQGADAGRSAQRRSGRRRGAAEAVRRCRRAEEKDHLRDIPPSGCGRKERAEASRRRGLGGREKSRRRGAGGRQKRHHQPDPRRKISKKRTA